MANLILWENATTSPIVGISAASLTGLAVAGVQPGNAYDNYNAANRHTFATFQLQVALGTTAGVAGDHLALYLVYAPDGTNYERGAASVTPNAAAWVGNFEVAQTTGAQYPIVRNVPILPFAFTPIVKNNCVTAALTGSSTASVLNWWPHDYELQ